MPNPPKWLLLWTAVLAIAPGISLPQANAEATCQPIRFQRGHSSGVVKGLAPPDGVRCYTMATANGQTAALEIISGRNVIFSIEGVVDARDSFAFRTEKKTYRILVGQLFRAVADEPFTLAISIR